VWLSSSNGPATLEKCSAGPRFPSRSALLQLNAAVRHCDFQFSSADSTATQILNEWDPVGSELWAFARVVGADKQLDWKHPDPDLRIAGICLSMANPEEIKRIEETKPAEIKPVETEATNRAQRFVSWLDDFTGAIKFREAALKRDLKNRGLTPVQFPAIYIARAFRRKIYDAQVSTRSSKQNDPKAPKHSPPRSLSMPIHMNFS
jgi:hypothetical protein